MNTYFELALIEKPGCKGLTKAEVMDLYDMLSQPEAYPVEIGDVDGNIAAIGFITPQAAEELQYEYGQDSELGQFISSILDDMEKESEDGTYLFKNLRIWMSRNEYLRLTDIPCKELTEEKNTTIEESDFDDTDIFRDPVIEKVDKHYTDCRIPKKVFDVFHNYLFYMPIDKEHCLSENETYTIVAKFDDGKYMEIRCHGVQYNDDERYTNTAWTEAVLFDENGAEISRAEPGKHLDGVWSLGDGNDIYTATINAFDDKEANEKLEVNTL